LDHHHHYPSRQLAEHTHYFPYGELWLQERPSTPVPYLFSAKELDPETGLYDFGARYLNPRFAQWMTTDPALGDYLGGEGIHTPPNLALYGYSWNSPAVLTDRNGRDVVCGGLCVIGLTLAGAFVLGTATDYTTQTMMYTQGFRAEPPSGTEAMVWGGGTSVAITGLFIVNPALAPTGTLYRRA
jgi:RHS repeat-associated protein